MKMSHGLCYTGRCHPSLACYTESPGAGDSWVLLHNRKNNLCFLKKKVKSRLKVSLRASAQYGMVQTGVGGSHQGRNIPQCKQQSPRLSYHPPVSTHRAHPALPRTLEYLDGDQLPSEPTFRSHFINMSLLGWSQPRTLIPSPNQRP